MLVDPVLSGIDLWRLHALASKSLHHLQQFQNDRIKRILLHCSRNIPFYRRIWSEAGFDGEGSRGLSDLEHLPLIDRAILQKAIADGEFGNRSNPDEKHVTYMTSGSSGTALKLQKSSGDIRRWKTNALRTWWGFGIKLSDTTVKLEYHPNQRNLIQKLGLLNTICISTHLPADVQLKHMLDAGADILVGTPTQLRRMARLVSQKTLRPGKPRVIFCHGEYLDSRTRSLIKAQFKVDPASLYGLTETGAIAWQCQRRNAFHINMETFHMEIVSLREHVPGSMPGKIVVTDLHNTAMPLVRYDTGDLGAGTDKLCQCGRHLSLIQSIEGRRTECLRLANERLLPPRIFIEHMSQLLFPDEYRISQEKNGIFSSKYNQ